MKTCPHCNGEGGGLAHLNYGGGRGDWKWVPCTLCKGEKQVADEVADLIRKRRQARDRRVRAGLSSSELAVRADVTARAVSDYEWARDVTAEDIAKLERTYEELRKP